MARTLLASGMSLPFLPISTSPVYAQSPKELDRDKPLPELLSVKELPTFELDVDESTRHQRLILKDGKHLKSSPIGCVVSIPAGARIPLGRYDLAVVGSWYYRDGARVIFSGSKKGPRPILFSAGQNGLFNLRNSRRLTLGFELENLVLKSGDASDCIRVPDWRYVRLSNVKIEGGKHGLFLSALPIVVAIEDSEISHGGRGDGLSHGVYINHIEKCIVRNSKFHSAKADGHTFKCYASIVDIRDSLFASWLDEDDKRQGFVGGLPLVDLGAWSNSLFMSNTFIRRGPARTTCIDIRNRQYAKGISQYRPPDWGTQIVDHRKVDNRDVTNPYLFRHIFVNNRFVNGVLPNGKLDPLIEENPGIAVRNNGSAPWASRGDTEPAYKAKPRDWQNYNERSVTWLINNVFEGVPFDKIGQDQPFGHPEFRAPIRFLEQVPSWLQL